MQRTDIQKLAYQYAAELNEYKQKFIELGDAIGAMTLPCPTNPSLPVGLQAIISGCPQTPVAVGTQIVLTGGANEPVASYQWARLSGTPNPNLSTDQTLSFTALNVGELVLQLTVCTALPFVTRRDRLLAAVQPTTGMLSRTGWGMGATGGGNEVEVSTAAEFISAVEAGGNHVIVMPALANTRIVVDVLKPGANTIIDAADAPGFEIGRDDAGIIMTITEDNVILHCFTFRAAIGPQITGLNVRNGRDFWFNQLSFYDFQGTISGDDSITIGGSTASQHTGFYTISNCYFHDNCYGNVTMSWYPKDIGSGLYGNVTMHSNWCRAAQRVMKIDGGRNLHIFDTVIDDTVQFSKIDIRNDYDVAGAQLAAGMKILAEGIVAISAPTTVYKGINRVQANARAVGNVIYTSDYLLLSGAEYEGRVGGVGGYVMDVTDTGNPNYGSGPDFPTYDYSLMAGSAQIQALVQAEAGALVTHEDAPDGNGDCATTTCTITVV